MDVQVEYRLSCTWPDIANGAVICDLSITCDFSSHDVTVPDQLRIFSSRFLEPGDVFLGND